MELLGATMRRAGKLTAALRSRIDNIPLSLRLQSLLHRFWIFDGGAVALPRISDLPSPCKNKLLRKPIRQLP